VKARAELEVYRSFAGRLRDRRLRFWPITAANLRVMCKRKRALFVFYVPPAIGMIVGCFLVYVKFGGPQVLENSPGAEMGLPVAAISAQLDQMIQIRAQIFGIMNFQVFFSMLASIWFGSGLLCEDKRAGAHLLYFTRPITRLDYFLGKFLTFATLAGVGIFVPGIVICIFAAFSSPEWSFLEQEWDLFFRVTAYALLWVVAIGSVTLCISSLASRRVFALIGTTAFFLFSQGVAQVLGQVIDRRFHAIGVLDDFMFMIGPSLFEQPIMADFPSPGAAYVGIATISALALFIVARRIRSWEVVG
jgi:ABC-type transport system involved in multi-copper enzyme maturation permease subunit